MHHFILSFQDDFLLDRSETTAGNQRCKRGECLLAIMVELVLLPNMHVSSAYNSPPKKKRCIKQTILFENTLFYFPKQNKQKQNQETNLQSFAGCPFSPKGDEYLWRAFFSLDLPGHETRRDETSIR